MTRWRSLGRLPAAWTGGRGALALSAAMLALVGGIDTTQDAVANGDTRTIEIIHDHTQESASITFRRDGRYDAAGLKQLNWLLRDWRTDQPTRMDPRLFDIVWQVSREVGAGEPIHVVSAYRSPETNASLRRRSRAVAEHSQHMLGKAMDFYLPGVSMARVREVGMRLQGGGVGFYPHSAKPFVHLDAGSVRHWPRMPRAQLARLFPDGRTVHMPKDGKPLSGFEEAKASILARGGSVPGSPVMADAGEDDLASTPKSLWTALFGGSRDEDDVVYRETAIVPKVTPVAVTPAAAPAEPASDPDTGGRRTHPQRSGTKPNESDAVRALFTASATPLPPARPAGLPTSRSRVVVDDPRLHHPGPNLLTSVASAGEANRTGAGTPMPYDPGAR